MHKIGQSGGFLGRLLAPLLKTGLPLIGNGIKSVLIPLGSTAAATATNSVIHKKMFWSGTTTLSTSHEETNDITKIVKYLEESAFLIKGVSETIKNEAKEQKRGFLGMLLGTVGASLLGNLLTGKDTFRAGRGAKETSQGQGTTIVGENL